MVQQLCVSRDRFWQALLHCKNPVYLSKYADCDLRFLSEIQRDSILPLEPTSLTTVSVHFHDKLDYVRFVLAYLLMEII